MKFTRQHETDLLWYYREAGGDLGLSSSLGPMINLAMSGIQQGGKTITQHTAASMDSDSPVERQRRIGHAIGALDATTQRVIALTYGPRRDIERKGDSPKEAGEWRAILAPAERLFGELAPLVVGFALGDSSSLERDKAATYKPTKGTPKDVALVEARAVASRVADAKKAIARATAEATRMVDAARVAYAVAVHDVPSPKARRSLENYAAWCGGKS